jgi:hypothetical protein
MDAQLSSRLFALPPEIRTRILSYVASFPSSAFADSLRPSHDFLESLHATPLPPLILTCKLAYDELSHCLTTAALRVCMYQLGRRVSLACWGRFEPSKLTTLYLVIAMNHANWNAWLKFLRELLSQATQLRELTIDWEPRCRPAAVPQRGWMAGHEGRMEEQFFSLIGGLKELAALRVHGEVGAHWEERLKSVTAARVVMRSVRWWREDMGELPEALPLRSRPDGEEGMSHF